MENSKDHKAAAEPPLDCRVSGLKHRHGFVLVTPQREIVAETFRPTREAAKGWLIMLEVDGRYERWDWFYRRGWRCRPAELLVDTKPANAEIRGA